MRAVLNHALKEYDLEWRNPFMGLEVVRKDKAEPNRDQRRPFSAEQVELVKASYAMFVEDKIAKPLGLTLAQWNSYIDPADLSEFRAMTVRGDWDGLRAHA